MDGPPTFGSENMGLDGIQTTTLRAYERYFSGASLDFVKDYGPFKTPYLPCSRCATCLVAFYLHLVNFNGTGAGEIYQSHGSYGFD